MGQMKFIHMLPERQILGLTCICLKILGVTCIERGIRYKFSSFFLSIYPSIYIYTTLLYVSANVIASQDKYIIVFYIYKHSIINNNNMNPIVSSISNSATREYKPKPVENKDSTHQQQQFKASVDKRNAIVHGNRNITSTTPPVQTVKIKISKEGQARCHKNSTEWSCCFKTGGWEDGKGKNNKGEDKAVFQGAKGEEGLSEYCQVERDDKPTETPVPLDFFATKKSKTEVKTSTPGYPRALIRVQNFNKYTNQFEWLSHKDYPSIKGLFAEYYVFCKATDTESKVDSWDVELCGWITRSEILQKYSTLYNQKRPPKPGELEWKNFEVPYAALHPMSTFKEHSAQTNSMLR